MPASTPPSNSGGSARPRGHAAVASRQGRPAWGESPGHRLIIGAAATVLLLLAWQGGAELIGKDIVLPSPAHVLGIAGSLYPTRLFLQALWATFLRGLTAFGITTTLGLFAGLASGLWPLFGAALAPLMTTIRATPVLALILLALIWFPSGFVPIFAAFLMAFPVMVSSAAQGARAADPRLVEMARLFRVPRREQFFKLKLPAAAPHLISGARSALGLSWKVVVAGEVLSQPLRALGTGMQNARVLLETGQVFAWALASVLLCGLTEWVFGMIATRAARHGL
ncbi:MAG TPA: ABC transporter permease subunit [Rectinemataceae bacterium]|nr:ABC transporter permease subunit [Rectinemataceae bacterium]